MSGENLAVCGIADSLKRSSIERGLLRAARDLAERTRLLPQVLPPQA